MRITIYILILLLQLSSLLLAGCGLTRNQITVTQSFGTATAALGNLGEQEFVSIRAGIIDMNAALLTLDTAKTTSNLVLDAPASPAATAKRVAAGRALKAYGNLLVALAGADRSAALQEAAATLTASLESVMDDGLSEAQQDAVQDIIVGTGSLLLDKKKAAAVRKIVPAYAQPVDDLALLLAEDFSLDDAALGFLQAYDTTARRLKNAAMRIINAGGKYPLLERERAVQAYLLAETALNRAQELGKRASAALHALRRANRELVRAVAEDKYSREDIKDYAKQIVELANAYQVLAE